MTDNEIRARAAEQHAENVAAAFAHLSASEQELQPGTKAEVRRNKHAAIRAVAALTELARRRRAKDRLDEILNRIPEATPPTSAEYYADRLNAAKVAESRMPLLQRVQQDAARFVMTGNETHTYRADFHDGSRLEFDRKSRDAPWLATRTAPSEAETVKPDHSDATRPGPHTEAELKWQSITNATNREELAEAVYRTCAAAKEFTFSGNGERQRLHAIFQDDSQMLRNMSSCEWNNQARNEQKTATTT